MDPVNRRWDGPAVSAASNALVLVKEVARRRCMVAQSRKTS